MEGVDYDGVVPIAHAVNDEAEEVVAWNVGDEGDWSIEAWMLVEEDETGDVEELDVAVQATVRGNDALEVDAGSVMVRDIEADMLVVAVGVDKTAVESKAESMIVQIDYVVEDMPISSGRSSILASGLEGDAEEQMDGKLYVEQQMVLGEVYVVDQAPWNGREVTNEALNSSGWEERVEVHHKRVERNETSMRESYRLIEVKDGKPRDRHGEIVVRSHVEEILAALVRIARKDVEQMSAG